MTDDDLDETTYEDLIAEVRRLRGLLQRAADENNGAPSGYCRPNCPWCNAPGRDLGADESFIHAANCQAYTPEGLVKHA